MRTRPPVSADSRPPTTDTPGSSRRGPDRPGRSRVRTGRSRAGPSLRPSAGCRSPPHTGPGSPGRPAPPRPGPGGLAPSDRLEHVRRGTRDHVRPQQGGFSFVLALDLSRLGSRQHAMDVVPGDAFLLRSTPPGGTATSITTRGHAGEVPAFGLPDVNTRAPRLSSSSPPCLTAVPAAARVACSTRPSCNRRS